MKLRDALRSPVVQASFLADVWVCRSCGEFIESTRPQGSPGSCRSCLGTRFSTVLSTSRHRQAFVAAHRFTSTRGSLGFAE